jgi:hypothetical protein
MSETNTHTNERNTHINKNIIKQILHNEVEVLLNEIKNDKPNLYELWSSYCIEKENTYISYLKDTSNKLKKIKEHSNDIHKDSIQFLLMLYFLSDNNRLQE